jgi:ribosomal protein S18 acetylase RimI-like enzyme
MHPTIRLLQAHEMAAFFHYLDQHLRDNGSGGTPLFQPLPRQSGLPREKLDGFSRGLETALDRQGWRRVWLAHGADGILGHVDLRTRAEGGAGHRALLGMGVHRSARRQGLGLALLDVAIDWARAQGLAWIDLEVLSENAPARALYRQRGFIETGCIADLFRIEGHSLAYCYMSLALGQQAAAPQTG